MMEENKNTELKLEGETNYNVPNLEKGLAVLEVLADAPFGMTLQELRNAMKISLTTAYRILNTLVRHGYLFYDEDSKKYSSSMKMLTIGFKSLQEHNLLDLVLPKMRELRNEIEESVFFGVLSEDGIIVLEKSIGTHAFCFYVNTGKKLPLHCSAPGKAMLAALPQEISDEYMNRISFIVHNENTIGSKEQMEKELETVRSRGYALDLEEEMSGVVCVGCSILNYAGLPCGCLWTSAPKARLKPKNLEKIGKRFMEVTSSISTELGYRKN